MTEPARRPIVIVIENPNDDPTVFAFGDVEVINLSSYPTTSWADDERDPDDTYPTDLRALAGRVAGTPGADTAVAELHRLADLFERRLPNAAPAAPDQP